MTHRHPTDTPTSHAPPSSRPPPTQRRVDPLRTDSLEAFMAPGVVVEMDPTEAEALGAFEETALTEAEAWVSHTDVDGEGTAHGPT